MAAKTKPAQGKAKSKASVTKPTTPNSGKSVTAKTTKSNKVPAKKAAKKKPAPKKPVITKQDFEQWFFKLSREEYMQLSIDWHETKLKIRLPKLDNYDQWLNYFKKLSPAVTRQLADTGGYFIPNEGFAALSRWHDIISNPHRIDKIYQAGLRNNIEGKSIVELAEGNDELGVLKALRFNLAQKLEKGAGTRDTVALSEQLASVMGRIKQIEKALAPKQSTVLGTLLEDVTDARDDPKPRKRPSENGGGARHTSFKARVTIDDLEK